MISKPRRPITTAEQLWGLPDDGNRYELVNGVLHMLSPAGSEHGEIAGRILRRLGDHVERHGLGKTYAAETGFRIACSPDTVRAPDVAFVSNERLATVAPTRGYLPLAPDLVVEVVAISDNLAEVEAKVADWLSAGTQIVLVADPTKKTLQAYQRTGVRTFQRGETFCAEPACAGWQLAVDDAFPRDE